jgi:hypothetical protein
LYLVAQHVLRNYQKHPVLPGCSDPSLAPREADHFFHYDHGKSGFPLTTQIDKAHFDQWDVKLVDSKTVIPLGDNQITSFIDVVTFNALPVPTIQKEFQQLLDTRAFKEPAPSHYYTDIAPEEGAKWGYSVRVPWRVVAQSNLVGFHVCSASPKFWFEEGPRLMKILLEWYSEGESRP